MSVFASTPIRPRVIETVSAFTLTDTEPGLSPDQLAAHPRNWTPAVVPGGVHESLLAAGTIDHPYYDRNEGSVAWIEERDWWYRATFAAPVNLEDDERLRIVFHGLDTVVDIWLNDALLGSHANMFRPAEFDITDRVQATNDLLLRFSPPLAGLSIPANIAEAFERLEPVLAAAKAADPSAEIVMSDVLATSTLRRKAAFSWGWDFAPRVPSLGVWRPVELQRHGRAAMRGHHIRTDALDLDQRTARLSLKVETEGRADGELTARVSLTSPAGATAEYDLPIVDGVAVAAVTVADVEPWWTHDIGTPALYDVRIELLDNGEVRDVATDRVGLRTIEIDQSPDVDGGRIMRFILNGVPIFARGACWLPADMLVGSIPDQRYRDLVRLAQDGNMNMLRVWGGGIYEADAFYDATDELGILVWQDFSFACVDYPSDNAELLREVELEAEYQVTRLRNRASLGMWCGNNEVQEFHGFAYQDYEPGPWGWDIFHRILPDAVRRLDGSTPYRPGSPWGEGTPEGWMAVNGVMDGDRHAWEVWHGSDWGAGGGPFDSIGEARHYRRYAKDKGKFISEFGIHASPARSTLERWIPADKLAVHSESFDHHNKDHPKTKGDAILEIITGIPRTIDEYVDYTMVSQAEGLKFGVEHYRRRQPHCNGTLVWQFNDVWPGFSWSLIDYDTVPKAGYYAAKRAFTPVLASFVYEAGELALWISNSGALAVNAEAVITLQSFSGEVRADERIRITVDAGESRVVWRREIDLGERAASDFAWVESVGDIFLANRLYFAEIKDLDLPAARLATRVERTGPTSARVTVEADTFAYLVRVTSPHPTARFDDNFVDMRPGTRRVISVEGLPEDFDLADLAVSAYVG
ncbi:glycoside hydrolase family 2 protein [Tessaracoccus palaemonis]|uniref:Beta-mannosidase n=1 Tax=Tessaracoccus palaemonis TaxID=2829499 RepID=A0ABX8SKA5_9ACTN|nr:glycoside hydrolase family 2 protein [Tessaracoccus palaemonis]QXT62867.1 beta-mannosidase [Tessaracoccus palaemonis]